MPILGAQSSGAKSAPGVPTVGTATVTNATTVSLTFTAPFSKLPITSYTVTSSPSISLSTSGTSSPVTVTGTFADGQAYTFTMTATNASETSTASSASNSITPYTRPTYFVLNDINNTNFYYSTDAVTWSTTTTSATNGRYGMGYGNGYYATVTGYTYDVHSGQIWYSSNLTSWTMTTLPKPTGPYSTGAQQGPMGYADGIWLTAGQGGSIFTSTNLTSWTYRATDGATEWASWAYGGGYHVLVGSNKVAYSTNGTTWTTGQPFSTHAQYSVGYGPDGFFSGGYQRNIYTGGPASWTQRVAPVSGAASIQRWKSAAYGNGVYLFGTDGSNGFLSISTNLTSWSTQALPVGSANGAQNVLYSTRDNLWLVAGDNTATVSVSTNAVTWTSRTVKSSGTMSPYGAIWG